MQAAFYKGVLLWQYLQEIDFPASRTDDPGYSGLRRKRRGSSPKSPGFGRQISVKCQVDPQADYDDLEAGATLLLGQVQLDDALIDVSDGQAHLSYAQNHEDVAQITGGPYAAGSNVPVSHDAFTSGWTAIAGRLVLLRSPATGAGFVTSIGTVGTGTLTLLETSEEITDAWEMIYVQGYWPEAVYLTTQHGSLSSAGKRQDWKPEVIYEFTTGAALISAAAHAVPRGT